MRDPRVYREHVLEAIAWIEEDTEGRKDTFLGSRVIRSAVLRYLQTMAEATQRIPPDLKKRHAEIDWAGISAFLNVLVHGYLGVDPELVWDRIENDLPPLKAAVLDLLELLDAPEGLPD